MFYVYAHKKPDGKIFYIGKGKCRRAWDCYKRNNHWNNIAQKYGRKVEILAWWENEIDAFEHEKLLISCFKDLNYELVNLTDGGEGFSGGKHSEKAKKLMSETRKGKNNGMFGKKRPEISGINHHMHLPEIAKKVSEKVKGGLNPSAKKVKFQNKVFDCIVDLAKYANLHPKTVQRRIRTNPGKYNYELL